MTTYSLSININRIGPSQLLARLTGIFAAVSSDKPERLDTVLSPGSDIQDVNLSRNGDGDAYGRLVERHQARISSMMWRFSRDPLFHRELVQDVFIEAYRSLRTFRGKAPFGHWLARIATRIGYRYWKKCTKDRTNATVTLEEWDQLAQTPPEDIEPSRAGEILYTLLQKLPPRDRLVLTSRYIDDNSVEETARLTGWSKVMVKVQTSRAKKKLIKLFNITGKEQ